MSYSTTACPVCPCLLFSAEMILTGTAVPLGRMSSACVGKSGMHTQSIKLRIFFAIFHKHYVYECKFRMPVDGNVDLPRGYNSRFCGIKITVGKFLSEVLGKLRVRGMAMDEERAFTHSWLVAQSKGVMYKGRYVMPFSTFMSLS